MFVVWCTDGHSCREELGPFCWLMVAAGIVNFGKSHQFAEQTSQMQWFHWNSESCSGSDRQQTTKQWLWPPPPRFFWCKFGFGKCFGASSWTSHWASHSVLPYKIHLWHITIQLRNDSLLYRIRVDDTSKWQIFQFVVISQGTHLLSFFTFPICFTYQTSIEWLKLSPWATSQVVVRGSTSMILSVGHCQLPMAGHYASHFQGSHFRCKISWITLHSMFINSF